MTSYAIAAWLSPIFVAHRLGHGSTPRALDRYVTDFPALERRQATF